MILYFPRYSRLCWRVTSRIRWEATILVHFHRRSKRATLSEDAACRSVLAHLGRGGIPSAEWEMCLREAKRRLCLYCAVQKGGRQRHVMCQQTFGVQRCLHAVTQAGGLRGIRRGLARPRSMQLLSKSLCGLLKNMVRKWLLVEEARSLITRRR